MHGAPSPTSRWVAFVVICVATLSLADTAVAVTGTALAHDDTAFDAVEGLRLRAGILRAEDERDASDHLLAEALRCRDAVIRARAVRALGRIGEEDSIPALRRFLVDGIPAVQREAIFALGEVEHGVARESLVHVLGSKDPEERALAVESLAKIAAAEPSLAGFCAAPVVHFVLAPGAESDVGVLKRALNCSWRFGAKADGLVQAVSAAFLRQESDVSTAAVFAAARLADRRFAPLLSLAAHDERPLVRAFAASGLGRLARLPGEQAIRTDEHRAILVRRGLDRDPLVRIAAFGALSAFPADTKMAAEMLAPSLTGDDPGPQRAALALVKAWGIGASAEELIALALGDREDLAVDAAGALAAVAGDAAIETLSEMAKSPTWTRRAAAAEALGLPRLATGPGRDLLNQLLADSDARIVASALEAAVTSGRSDAAVLALAHLGAEDGVVRAVAGSALADLVDSGALDRAEALRALRRAWSDGLADATPDARLAALEAASHLLDGQLTPLIARAANDSDFVVRLRAHALAEKAGTTAPAPVGLVGARRPMAFYQDAARQEMAAARTILRLDTTRGPLEVELASAEAVLTVRHLTGLARAGYFDGLSFHRVVPGFVVQGGDPRGDGWGGPGGSIRCEINRLRYDRGAAGMALSGKDTGGSQFFFTLTDQPHLDGGYTVFGYLTPESLSVLDQVQRFDRILKASVLDAPLAAAAPSCCCPGCDHVRCCCLEPGGCCVTPK